jgi:hypothetical protein
VTASASTSAVAGRWRSPLAWSSRRRPSAMAGTRTKTKGTAAASAMTAKASTAAARPTGGSHSHTPSQEMVRNRPAAVASVASAGHRRSQKIVQRARRNAVASADPAGRSAPRWPGAAVLDAISVTQISAKENSA